MFYFPIKKIKFFLFIILFLNCKTFKINNINVKNKFQTNLNNNLLNNSLKNNKNNDNKKLIKKQQLNETIYGLSSGIPEGGCGIAIIRISGPNSKDILNILTQKKEELKHREANFCNLYSVKDKSLIDKVITLYFKSPNSYTGEDIIEIHTHGSKAVITEIFNNFRIISNNFNIKLRQAERGEFTRRAFYSGKYNLTQVEGIRELIASTNQIQLRNSLEKINNKLFNLYEKWKKEFISLLSSVEAYLDFQEESNFGTETLEILNLKRLSKLKTEIKHFLNNKREKLAEGVKILLAGPPNSGKSTFMNNLFEEEVSIVSGVPGTTRDLIRVCYEMEGLNFQVVDSAGIRDVGYSSEKEEIERIGIKKVFEELGKASIIVFLFDPLNIEASLYSLSSLFLKNHTNSNYFTYFDTFVNFNNSNTFNNSKHSDFCGELVLPDSRSSDYSECLDVYGVNYSTDKNPHLKEELSTAPQEEKKLFPETPPQNEDLKKLLKKDIYVCIGKRDLVGDEKIQLCESLTNNFFKYLSTINSLSNSVKSVNNLNNSNNFKNTVNNTENTIDISKNNNDEEKVVRAIFRVNNLEKKEVKRVIEKIYKNLKKDLKVTEPLFINQQRHKSRLNSVLSNISKITELVESNQGLEVISEYLRDNICEIELITGECTDDSVLDEIFSSFCVGK